jgi:hypothetical protein
MGLYWIIHTHNNYLLEYGNSGYNKNNNLFTDRKNIVLCIKCKKIANALTKKIRINNGDMVGTWSCTTLATMAGCSGTIVSHINIIF